MSRSAAGGLRRVPQVADLETWTSFEWTGGVQVDELAPLDRLVVRTRNSGYDITVIEPHRGGVLVQGGRFFPEPTRAHLAGASLGGSFLKMRGIYPGLRMELCRDGMTVVTSPVRSIDAVAPEGACH